MLAPAFSASCGDHVGEQPDLVRKAMRCRGVYSCVPPDQDAACHTLIDPSALPETSWVESPGRCSTQVTTLE